MPPSNPSFQLRTNINFGEIRQRLRSEYGSATQSEAEISAALADVDKDLKDCDTEFRRLQSRIIVLQNQRKRLEDYKSCLRFLRSPIRRLPNETVLRIFDFACDMNDLTSKKLQTMPALVISGVCSRWWNLARSCPELWSRIQITFWSTPRHLPDLPILDLYLASSQQALLTLELSWIKGTALESDHRAVCATLGACSNRWQRLTVLQWAIYEAIIAHNPSDFPFLECLEQPNLIHGSSVWLHRFQGASNLRALSFSRTLFAQLQKNKDLLMRLTVFDIAQCDPELKGIFEICPNLKVLRFRQFQDDAIKLCSPPISAPFIQKLALTLRQTPHPDPERLANVIFASITCPSLTSLFIEGLTGYKHKWPRDAVNGFISRSSFHFSTLSIKFIPLFDSDLIDLLRHLPSLQHLTVDDSNTASPTPITSLLVQSLHAFPRTTSVAHFSLLAKRVQSLSLTTSAEAQEAFSDRDFVDMVSSRWFPDSKVESDSMEESEDGTACLRSVVMRFTKRVVDEEIYAPLKYLEEEGMRVVVIGQNS